MKYFGLSSHWPDSRSKTIYQSLVVKNLSISANEFPLLRQNFYRLTTAWGEKAIVTKPPAPPPLQNCTVNLPLCYGASDHVSALFNLSTFLCYLHKRRIGRNIVPRSMQISKQCHSFQSLFGQSPLLFRFPLLSLGENS